MSKMAYETCVYVRVLDQDGFWPASLVFSHARVAPLKSVSLPQLVLLGALLCSLLVVQVYEALRLPEDTVCHCWIYSTVALACIKSHPQWWKPFVANRVAEIQSLTAPYQWHHAATKDNLLMSWPEVFQHLSWFSLTSGFMDLCFLVVMTPGMSLNCVCMVVPPNLRILWWKGRRRRLLLVQHFLWLHLFVSQYLTLSVGVLWPKPWKELAWYWGL